jgi:hypothetical protein
MYWWNMTDNLVLACVAPSLIERVWPRVADMIERGYEVGDDFMPKDIVDRLVNNRMQLWVAMTDPDGIIYAAMTTELVPMRSGLVCWMCQAAGTRLKDWKQFHEKIEEYAKAEGCVKTVLRGRVGWQKALEGYSVRTVQLEKTL